MKSSETYLNATVEPLASIIKGVLKLIPKEPARLYDPIRYFLGSGGKRIRPALTYFTSLSDSKANWLPAACAVELLHNFTLIHDDIMDNAPLRRGKKTVHEKYGLDTAILAGDVAIALAEESLAAGKYEYANEMMAEFASTFRAVCEGQAYDKEFETSADISLADYIHMIDLKSAKMLELAAVLGAYSAGGKDVEACRTFAHHTGIAFQIRDDLLDLIADAKSFGKKKGGDVIEGKRTYLFVRANEQFTTLRKPDQALLKRISTKHATTKDVVLYERLLRNNGIIASTEEAIAKETRKAHSSLGRIADKKMRDSLARFGEYLLGRAQ